MPEILVHASPVVVTGPFFPYGSVYGRADRAGTVMHVRARVPVADLTPNPVLVPAVAFAAFRVVDLTLVAVGANITGGPVRLIGMQNGVVVNLFTAQPADLQRSEVSTMRQMSPLADAACFALCDRNTGIAIGSSVILGGAFLDIGLTYVAELAVTL